MNQFTEVNLPIHMEVKMFSIAAFLAVIEHNSFTDAAKSLGVSKSKVSKAVSLLEAQLGCNLFNCTTRRVQPTELGVELVPKARKCMDAVAELSGIEAVVPQPNVEVPTLTTEKCLKDECCRALVQALDSDDVLPPSMQTFCRHAVEQGALAEEVIVLVIRETVLEFSDHRLTNKTTLDLLLHKDHFGYIWTPGMSKRLAENLLPKLR